MDTNSGDNESNPDGSVGNVDDLTKQFAKIWWLDTDKENPGNGMSKNTTFVKSSNGRNIWVDKEKYQASLSLLSSMEKLRAKEMYEMDAREREDIANEIHGVQSSQVIQETPQVISEGVESLKKCIDQTLEANLDTDEKSLPKVTREVTRRILASELQEQSKNKNIVPYIYTRTFLLKFLRASRFDVEKAGQHYFRWIDFMHCLFGDIALQRPLMMTDLTLRELRYLRTGQLQILPSRDRAGRRIFAYTGKMDTTITTRERFRTGSYVMDVCAEDVTTQKLGVIWLSSPKLDSGDNPLATFRQTFQKRYQTMGGLTEREIYHKFINSIPLRTAAIHHTGPDTFLYQVASAYVQLLNQKAQRQIIRIHYGSQMEINYSLKSYGIASEDVPVTDDGQIKNKKVAKFIAARKSIEAIRQQEYELQRGAGEGDVTTNNSTSIPSRTRRQTGVECPELNCVIFGNRARYNSANLEFRNILKVMEQDREEKIARCENVPSVREFINDIIQTAKSPPHNLRFMAIDKETSLFVEIENSQELYTTVSQALRDQRKRMRLDLRLTQSAAQEQEHQHQQRQRVNDGRAVPLDGFSGSILGFDASKRQKGWSQKFCYM